MTLAAKLRPILKEIEETIWDHEAMYPGEPIEWTREDLISSLKVVMSTCLVLGVKKMETEGNSHEDDLNKTLLFGHAMSKLIKDFTGEDPKTFYTKS